MTPSGQPDRRSCPVEALFTLPGTLKSGVPAEFSAVLSPCAGSPCPAS